MANPTGKGGKKFKPGQSGNPGGLSKAAQEMNKFKKTSYKDFLDKLQEFGGLSPAQMKERIQDPKAKMFDVIFGRILYDASQGKADARDVLLERLWGKVNYTVNDLHDKGDDDIKNMSLAELLAIVQPAMVDLSKKAGHVDK